jgi:four helix bundle protein
VGPLSKPGAFLKDLGLREQILRGSVSIISDIAEGFERSGTGEFIQFLAMAKGSSGEVKPQLYVVVNQGYIEKGIFDRLFTLVAEVNRMLGGLMNYLRKSKIRGIKYK